MIIAKGKNVMPRNHPTVSGVPALVFSCSGHQVSGSAVILPAHWVRAGRPRYENLVPIQAERGRLVISAQI
jgi:hypothetical protein